MRPVLILICLAALVACGRGNEAQETMKRTPPPAEAQANMSIGPQGAAGLGSGAQFNLESIRQMAPGYQVAEGHAAGARVITLTANNEIVFTLHPAENGRAIAEIDTRSMHARGPNGDAIGETTFGAVQFTDGQFCIAETLDIGAGFACASSRDSAFWRVFVLPASYHGIATPFEEIDPDHALQATLAEMRWKPLQPAL